MRSHGNDHRIRPAFDRLGPRLDRRSTGSPSTAPRRSVGTFGRSAGLGAAAGTPAPTAAGELWTDLPGLLAAADALDGAGAVVVRITELGQDGETHEGLDPSAPAIERYDLLGYDVADYDLLGGLTNCGYTPGEAASLAPAWAPLLNEWHLFDNPVDAVAYTAVTARRVPEHTPFFGYVIYQLR